MRRELALAIVLISLIRPATAASAAEGVDYFEVVGSIGPYRVGANLTIRDHRALVAAHYFYARKPADIPLTGDVTGETVTLREPGGGRFDLHLRPTTRQPPIPSISRHRRRWLERGPEVGTASRFVSASRPSEVPRGRTLSGRDAGACTNLRGAGATLPPRCHHRQRGRDRLGGIVPADDPRRENLCRSQPGAASRALAADLHALPAEQPRTSRSARDVRAERRRDGIERGSLVRRAWCHHIERASMPGRLTGLYRAAPHASCTWARPRGSTGSAAGPLRAASP